MAEQSVGVEVPSDAQGEAGAPPEKKTRKKREPKEGAAVSPKKPKRIQTAQAPAGGEASTATVTTRRAVEATRGKAKVRILTVEAEASGEELASLVKKLAEMF